MSITFQPKSVILAGNLSEFQSSIVGIPCSVSQSIPANQMRIIGSMGGQKAEFTFERRPLTSHPLGRLLSQTESDLLKTVPGAKTVRFTHVENDR